MKFATSLGYAVMTVSLSMCLSVLFDVKVLVQAEANENNEADKIFFDQKFPLQVKGMTRGDVRRGEFHKAVISTGYLIVTPEHRVTTSVVVSPVRISLDGSLDEQTVRFKKQWPDAKNLGTNTLTKVINGSVTLTKSASFEIFESIFGSKQRTFVHILIGQKEDEEIQIISRSPIDEYSSTPGLAVSIFDAIQ